MDYKVKTNLFDFQESTIRFLKKRELENKNSLVLNDAGLGKSLTILKFIENSPDKTLIICPSNLIYNWINEICLHTNFTKEKINVFHGSKRKLDDSLITVTSYSIISNSVKNIELFEKINQNFTRVVLDEGHFIRNKSTITSLAILQLTIPKRIIMTATPIFNRVADLYPIFKFLDLVSDEYDMKVLTGNLKSYKVLNKFIKENSIRYTKEVVLTDVKPNIIKTLSFNFSKDERDFYNTLTGYCNDRIGKVEERLIKIKLRIIGSSLKKIMNANLLVFILRLKQCANNPLHILKTMDRLGDCATLKQATKYLLSCKDNIDEECTICFDKIADYYAECGHSNCSGCWNRLAKKGVINCPHCRSIVTRIEKKQDFLEKPKQDITKLDFTISTKVQKVCDLIKEILDKNEKVVIVSQYIDTLEDIKENVKDQKYIDITGSIPLVQRQENIKKFTMDDNIKICYLSLTCGSEGINLIGANHLILVDLYWNQAKLDQVFNRINRIGQTKQTFIYKINIKDTIEKSISKLINKKQKLSYMLLKNLDEKKTYQKELEVLEEHIQFI